MFDAKSILVRILVTALRMLYLRMTNHRLLCLRGQVSPSRDTRVPQVCKSQDDSVGRSQSPFGYGARAISDRILAAGRAGARFQLSSSNHIREGCVNPGNTAECVDSGNLVGSCGMP